MPGVGAAPDALAGSTVAGEARFIETPSAHADVFGVGTTAAFGSMPVPPAELVTAGIAPGGGRLAGTSGIESGNDAALTACPPGVELHADGAPVPAGATAAIVPMALLFCPMTGSIGAVLASVGKPVLDTIGVAGTGVSDVNGTAQTTTVPGVTLRIPT